MYIYPFCVFCPVYEAHLDKQQNQQKREKGVIQREREGEWERERGKERVGGKVDMCYQNNSIYSTLFQHCKNFTLFIGTYFYSIFIILYIKNLLYFSNIPNFLKIIKDISISIK